MKGEFENRLRQVIDEVQASPKPIILFIDEAHTLIGAGGAAGHRRRRQPAEAGAGARHAAHDRRDDLGRVQEVHREGSGAHPPLPGRAGRRAERGEGDPDDARRRLDAREAPPRAGARRSARGGRAAVAPLHSGAPAAGQGGQPARHRVRARAISQHAVPPQSRTAGGASRRWRPSSRSSAARKPSASTPRRAGRRAEEKLAVERRRGSSSSRSAGRPRRTLVDRILEIRAASCARAASRSKARAARSKTAAQAQKRCQDQPAAAPLPRPKRRAELLIATRMLAELHGLQAKLSTLQGETPLILPSVDEQAVASVVADWTGIPVGRMVKNEIETRAQAGRDAEPARHRPAPRARDDRPAHPDLARQARQPEQADRRVHAVRARPASARPRPR